jgi:hypothetical protein
LDLSFMSVCRAIEFFLGIIFKLWCFDFVLRLIIFNHILILVINSLFSDWKLFHKN